MAERAEPIPGDATSQAAGPDDGCGAAHPTLPNAAPYVPRTKRWALIVVVVVSFALAAWVAAPLWVAVLLGVVMAISMQRVYGRLLIRLGERRASWAAGLVTVWSGLFFAIASAIVLFTLTNELMKLVTHLDQHGSSGNF